MDVIRRVGQTAILVSLAFMIASGEVYSPYQYDMSAPMYTPDGRLLQLEYACRAADHSAPIVLLPLGRDSSEESRLVAILTYRPSFRLQERLLVYQNNGLNMNNSNNNKSVMIGLAGVLADCGALGRKVQQDSMEHEGLYGTPFCRAHEWAMAASRRCQQFAIGGGIRPYGAHFVVVEGNHGRISNQDVASPSSHNNIFITDPSGAIHTLSSNEIERPFVLVGGQASTFKRTLENAWPRILERDNTPADQLARAFDIVRKAVIDDNGTGAKHRSDQPNTGGLVFEVVLVSEELGIHKLSPGQIDSINERSLSLKRQ